MNSKPELRDVFKNQPAYFVLLDGLSLLSVDQFNNICDSLKNVIALAVAMKSPSRISGLGVYYVSKTPFCAFPMQSIKLNFQKLHESLEKIKVLRQFPEGQYNCCNTILLQSFRHCVQQFEDFMKISFKDDYDRIPLQIMVLTHQPINIILKTVKEILPSLNTADIKKIQVVGISLLPSVQMKLSCYGDFMNDDNVVTEVEDKSNKSSDVLIEVRYLNSNLIDIEAFFKSIFQDFSNDAEHVRIQMKDNEMVLRCDLQECMINSYSIPDGNNFHLTVDTGTTQISQPNQARINATKIPIYKLNAVAIIPSTKICLSSIYGQPFVMCATNCWKFDWSVLCENRHMFSAVREYLSKNDWALIVERKFNPLTTHGNGQTSSYFAIFAVSHSNHMMIRSVAPRELYLPEHSAVDRSIPSDVPLSLKEDVKKCLDKLQSHQLYNPVSFHCGIYEQFSKMFNKSNFQRGRVRRVSTKTAKSAYEKAPFPSGNESPVFPSELKKHKTVVQKKSRGRVNERLFSESSHSQEKSLSKIGKSGPITTTEKDPEFVNALDAIRKSFDRLSSKQE